MLIEINIYNFRPTYNYNIIHYLYIIIVTRLTGREMLTLFAGLHGVKDPTYSADSYIKQLGIQKVHWRCNVAKHS